MYFPIFGLFGLFTAIFSAQPAASQGAPLTDWTSSLSAQREALKEAIQSDDTATMGFVHHGVLPGLADAPEFWSLVDILSERIGPPRNLRVAPRPYLIAGAAARLMPSCRVPYERMAQEAGRRAGLGVAADATREAVEGLISSPGFERDHAARIEAARRELILATDLTCRVLAPRRGHEMTAVAAMRLADEAAPEEVTGSQARSGPQGMAGQTCQPRFREVFREGSGIRSPAP